MNTTPDSSDKAAWEEAMSRDFDARVRDLHEAPLDIRSVKGRAHKIRRNRRAAVAGGILGVAAIVTPIAVLTGGDTDSREPDFAPQPTETATDPATGVDYVLKGVWHQSDGDSVELPAQEYDGAVVWDDQLVATRYDGEAYSFADVIAADGTVVRTFRTTQSVVVNDTGTTIAWVDPDTGDVMTAWDGGEVAVGNVDLAAAGETAAYWAAAVTGGPDCHEVEDGCVVHVNGGEGTVESFDSHGVNDSPLEQYLKVVDVQDGVATVLTSVEDSETCSALVDTDGGDVVAETCDFQLWQISPDGSSIAAPPSYFDGLGPTSVSVVDTSARESGVYAPEGGFIASWAWSADGNLVFDTYDGGQWHLMTLTPDGEVTEVAEAVQGEEFDSPFALIQH